jgi:Xaa-Pro aminopeptidase
MPRLKQLAAALRVTAATADALLVTHPPDVRYLTGFTGSNAALVVFAASGKSQTGRLRRPTLFTDGRYIAQARQETRGAKVVIAKGPVLREACEWMLQQRVRHCAIDGEQITVAVLERMRRILPGGLRRGFFLPIAPLVSKLREIKDPEEIRRMRAAAALGCRLFENLLTRLEPGRRETEIAAELEFAARKAGAEAMSFETIVAGGPRSAMPHGKASVARLPRRGFVVLDFGVILNGYCSDMTRTVHLGPATTAEYTAYEAVLEAQQAAVASVRPGMSCGDVDEAARSVLRGKKLGSTNLTKFFTHSTGHGVGLEIHEGPHIAAGQRQTLERGMVITIEPGVYLPGRFGIRIEDMVLVTAGGAEVLTPVPKSWIEL